MTTHLLVLIHGMWGNPDHLAEMHRVILEKCIPEPDDGTHLEVLVSRTNSDKSTYDGIDWGGERIAEEILDKVAQIEADGTTKVTRFSAVGYSLGGLLARYVLGVLLARNFFDKVQPVNFATIATPHCGLIRSGSFLRTIFARLGPHFLSRTGEHFYGVDKWSNTGKPLLQVMVDKDRVFFQALSQFKHVDFYANAVNDRTVPFMTAAVEPKDPFMAHETNGIEIRLSEQYDPLVDSFTLPSTPPPPPPKPSIRSMSFFRSFKPSRPWLPPALQFRFPANILMTALMPILIPIFISLLLLRLGLDARASRARIKLLESDSSRSDTLANLLASIEKKVDGVVLDILNDPQQSPEAQASDPPLEAQVNVGASVPTPPVLTPMQHLIMATLNTLPQLQKHFAFIHPVMNSHAVIVSRDVKRFAHHKRGEGILRHWADRFEL